MKSAEAPTPVKAADPALAAAILAALGGARNVFSVEAASNRLLVGLAGGTPPDEAALRRLGVRGVAHSSAGRLQLILPGDASGEAAAIGALIAA